MRMAELSRETGISVATIKYYLREGLLPPGERTSPNQARYRQEHVQRLRLIRALLDVGGLSIGDVGEVLRAMDAPGGPHKVFGVAQATILQPGLDPDDHGADAEWARERVGGLIQRLGWHLHPESPASASLARLLIYLRELGEDDMIGQLEARAHQMEQVAELDFELMEARPDFDDKIRAVVSGTVLGDAVGAALRRMAQVHLSAQRYGGPEELVGSARGADG